MVKVYYIEKKLKNDKIKKLNEDIKAKVKIIMLLERSSKRVIVYQTALFVS